jgi:siroheme synthase-like protein
MNYYPIAMRLKAKKVLIVGGGSIAERKVLSLLKAGARVKVVSPVLTTRLTTLAEKKKILWIKSVVRQDHLDKADIVIAATSNRGVNKKVSAWARKGGKPINVVDDQALSDFISPAILKKEQAIIAVYTDGKEPELSRDLKNYLKEHWDEFLSYRNRS